MSKNLDQLRASNPSPGLTPGSLLLQRIAGIDYAILVSQMVNTLPQEWNGAAYTPAKIVYNNVAGGPIWVSNGPTTAGLAPAAGNAEWTGYATIWDLLTYIFLNKANNNPE